MSATSILESAGAQVETVAQVVTYTTLSGPAPDPDNPRALYSIVQRSSDGAVFVEVLRVDKSGTPIKFGESHATKAGESKPPKRYKVAPVARAMFAVKDANGAPLLQ